MPDTKGFALLFACSLSGVAAQYFLTHGYRYISAVGGSIVSASRVYMASILGVVFFNDPVNMVLFAGTVLIVSSNVFVSRIEAA
jgi:drug/metabolite transporter (DMT)-like permease